MLVAYKKQQLTHKKIKNKTAEKAQKTAKNANLIVNKFWTKFR